MSNYATNSMNTKIRSSLSDNKVEVSSNEIIAANYYEDNFVPTLFSRWSPVIIGAAEIRTGHSVLDVACGTGIVIRDIGRSPCSSLNLSGLDISPGMIEVARSLAPEIDWHVGDAMALPFADDQFDRVVCQFGLMFFADRVKAVTEMMRVLKPGGKLAVLVWDKLANNPGFSSKVDILQKLAGARVADALRAPFCLGNRSQIDEIAIKAKLQDFDIKSYSGEACFQSLRQFIDAELRGWLPIMGVNLDEYLIERIYQQCEHELANYLDSLDGRLVMPTSALVLSAQS